MLPPIPVVRLVPYSSRFPLCGSMLQYSTNQPDHLDPLQSGTHWTTVKLPHRLFPALHFLRRATRKQDGTIRAKEHTSYLHEPEPGCHRIPAARLPDRVARRT